MEGKKRRSIHHQYILLSLSFVCIYSLITTLNIATTNNGADFDVEISRINHETPSASSNCLSLNHDLRRALKKTEQVFVTMPAKAAGTSMKIFANRCTNYFPPHNNFLHNRKYKQELLTWKYDYPKIIVNHVHEPLIDLVKGSTDESLIIYIHRKETDRLISAIKQTVRRYCEEYFSGNFTTPVYEKYNRKFVYKKGKHCVLHENVLIEMIKNRELEISYTNQNVWTCEAFNQVTETSPNLIFVDHSEASKLQSTLAKRFCPYYRKKWHFNDSKKIKEYLLVRFADKSLTDVPLSEWLEVKKHLLEWSLDLHQNGSCRGKMRQIEKQLRSCEDKVLHFSKIN